MQLGMSALCQKRTLRPSFDYLVVAQRQEWTTARSPDELDRLAQDLVSTACIVIPWKRESEMLEPPPLMSGSLDERMLSTIVYYLRQ